MDDKDVMIEALRILNRHYRAIYLSAANRRGIPLPEAQLVAIRTIHERLESLAIHPAVQLAIDHELQEPWPDPPPEPQRRAIE